jgi:hypothetical protein
VGRSMCPPPSTERGNDDLLINHRDAFTPLGMPLPTEHNFKAMRETFSDMLHEPQRRTAISIIRGEHCRDG